jgi:hypothetical protein
VPCYRLMLTEDSILGETFLLHSELILVESYNFLAILSRAVLLGRSWFSENLLA